MLHITYNYALQTLCGAPHNVCNDEGKLQGLPLNRMLSNYDVIAGTFFVVGLTYEDFTDLTPEQFRRYEELFHYPQVFRGLGDTILVENCTPEKYKQIVNAHKRKPPQAPER